MNYETIYTRTARWVATPLSELQVGDRVKITETNGDEHTVSVTRVGQNIIEAEHHFYVKKGIVEVMLDTESRPKRHLPSESLSRIDNVVTVSGTKYLYGIRGNLGWVLFSASGEVNYHIPSERIVSWDPHN